MALFEKHLVVKKSTLPNAGKGLFTKVFIPKRTRIVEYKGRITTWADVKEDDGENPYIFYIKRYHVIDALPTKKPLAAYIESTKNIESGSEIFVDYGPDYWKTMRENLAIDKKTKRDAEKKAKRKKVKKKKR
jgi:hypothetical protein